MNHSFRLSRVRAPRATFAASLLLIVVFISLGLVAAGLGVADAPATPRYLDGSTATYSHWLFSRLF